MGANTDVVLLGTLAVTLVAALVVLVMWRRARRRPVTSDNSVIDAFTHDLFAAQTTVEMKTVVARHLPPLLGTSQVWVSGYAGGRRQMIAPTDHDSAGNTLLSGSFQEWTTYPLRAGEQMVGLLGVDSTRTRDPHVREVMEKIAPLIAQALLNTHAVDVLREASLLDALTGTATRREGLARLQAELKRAQRTGASMAVLLLDLDSFKAINDRCGHAMGDAVLTAVGQTLRRTLRASDIRCRWGGEEFLVALPDTDLARANVVAHGLLKNIAAATVPTPQGPIGTTTSIGVTMTRKGEMDLEAIIQRADVALYRAKHAGRSRVRVVSAEGEPVDSEAEDGGTAVAVESPGAGPSIVPENTLPFPDRRNPDRPDRRRVPGPGRRSTDRRA